MVFADASVQEAVNRVLVSPPVAPPAPAARAPTPADPPPPEPPTSEPEGRAADTAAAAPMTLEQKKNLFLEFEARSRHKATHSRPVRFQRGGRLRAQRAQTQPITPDEVAAAAALPTSRRQPAAPAPAPAPVPAPAPAAATVDAYLAAAAAVGAVRGAADGCGGTPTVAKWSAAAAPASTPAKQSAGPPQRRRSMDEGRRDCIKRCSQLLVWW